MASAVVRHQKMAVDAYPASQVTGLPYTMPAPFDRSRGQTAGTISDLTVSMSGGYPLAAERMVRRTTASSTGILYAFFESGVASATAARAAERATSSLIR